MPSPQPREGIQPCETAQVMFLVLLVAAAGMGLVHVFERFERRWDAWRARG
jgi:ABC-type nitrate/sulfonate/bicarbonate transport system permease component